MKLKGFEMPNAHYRSGGIFMICFACLAFVIRLIDRELVDIDVVVLGLVGGIYAIRRSRGPEAVLPVTNKEKAEEFRSLRNRHIVSLAVLFFGPPTIAPIVGFSIQPPSDLRFAVTLVTLYIFALIGVYFNRRKFLRDLRALEMSGKK